MGDLIFRDAPLEVLAGHGLLHVADELFKIRLVIIEVMQAIHHHADAVIVGLIV